MATKPKRDSSGKFLPKWAQSLVHVDAFEKHRNATKDEVRRLWEGQSSLQGQLGELSSRVGSIGWQWAINLLGFAAIGYLGLKVYGYAPY